MTGQIIRTFQLKVGDKFIKQFITYRVEKIEGGRIYPAPVSARHKYYPSQSIGGRSQERVLLLTRLTP